MLGLSRCTVFALTLAFRANFDYVLVSVREGASSDVWPESYRVRITVRREMTVAANFGRRHARAYAATDVKADVMTQLLLAQEKMPHS